MTNCFRCKGELDSKLKTHAVTLEQCVIIVKNVPALVCNQCGEAYFTDDVMQKLETIVDKLESMIKEVAIVDYLDDVA
ncbi:MAG: type II toxin-antitoxin system MqsA family antitoxin [Defluviitaleaceae bacterium]|nr:type II toxin-antitoxin system MqsA family antitoxin [Defluviitaleaceae bacterium]MCL2263801.1 type II toxin-antitoxin system MqsA family antitoxin [Defluviitaleaceae bacterium]